MAKRSSARVPKKRASSRRSSSRKSTVTLPPLNIIGFIFLLLAVLAIFRLGFIGVLMANVLRLLVGDTYVIAALLLGFCGFSLMANGELPRLAWAKLGGLALTYAGSLLFVAALFFGQADMHSRFLTYLWLLLKQEFARAAITESVGGGLIGTGLYSVTYFLVSQIGTYVLAVLMMIGGAMLYFSIPFAQVARAAKAVEAGGAAVSRAARHHTVSIWQRIAAHFLNDPSTHQKTTEEPTPTEQAPAPADPPASPAPETPAQPAAPATDDFVIDTPPAAPAPAPAAKPEPAQPAPEEAADDTLPGLTDTKVVADYQLPPTSLLTAIPPTDQSAEVGTINKNRTKLEQTLASFGVQAAVKKASLGPAITKYEVQPAAGVKVSRIVNLTDDLALALAAKDIRMEAPIPGKPFIGIEVPNQQVSTVSFRDVVEHLPTDPKHLLRVPLGKDVAGKVISANLADMPHLLIAGSTGSGKSVMINTMITSLLLRTRPDQVKLLLIDPKMVELSVYNGVPHLLIPVVTEAKKAAGALNKVVAEMERRYELFAHASLRNMKEYNAKAAEFNQTPEGKKTPMPVLPYIVVIVDELSDLMMVAGNEVENAIVRLAQMARAAGIHMIIATQRPSVDVITGLIKANIPSRIAFAVSSGIDSRTILDQSGAEKLLGRGDMLFLPMGASKPVRVQGAYISSDDVEKVVAYVAAEQPANYDESMEPTADDLDGLGGDDSKNSEDEYFADAVTMLKDQDTASVSMLQRRFRIGYNRAARLMDELEAHGVVSGPDGSKPRKVLNKTGQAAD
ncbi:DNA translocase FtsK [Schleiferilactobacillus shenzhenensis]|uniref:DNA translocase FtsK n=1 Tax=Schleiferilactobacillus shenzhenensis TaxID=1231337 RepID=UPI0003FCB960|nr:DNA translocase FtsK [Schleiferilactobacillus shenzhenensis]